MSNVKKIVFWAPKGGVGKSTRCLEMGFALAELGKKVVILEFDAQKDVSKRLFRRENVQKEHDIKLVAPSEKEIKEGLGLDYPNFDDFYSRSKDNTTKPNNIYHAMAPALLSLQKAISTPDLIKVIKPSKEHPGGLWLLPGHADIQEYDSQMTLAYSSTKISSPVITAFDILCERIGKSINPDYILIDLDPSRGHGNGHLICSCDGLIIPCEADGPSFDAVKDALDWVVKFKDAYSEMTKLRNKTDKECRVKIMGTLQSNYTSQEGCESTYVNSEYAFWMRKIDAAMADRLPSLQQAELAFKNEEYEAAGVHLEALCLSRTPNWSSMNSHVDKFGTPVAFLNINELKTRHKRPKKLSGRQREFAENKIDIHGLILRNARDRIVKLLHGIRPQVQRTGSGGPPPAPPPAHVQPVMEGPLDDHRTQLTPAQQLLAKERRIQAAAEELAHAAAEAQTDDDAGPSKKRKIEFTAEEAARRAAKAEANEEADNDTEAGSSGQ